MLDEEHFDLSLCYLGPRLFLGEHLLKHQRRESTADPAHQPRPARLVWLLLSHIQKRHPQAPRQQAIGQHLITDDDVLAMGRAVLARNTQEPGRSPWLACARHKRQRRLARPAPAPSIGWKRWW